MNTNIQTLITIWCTLIFLSFSGNMYAQSTDTLFDVVSNTEAVLSASELTSYADLDNDKIKEKTLIDITGIAQSIHSSALSVPLKGINHPLKSRNISTTSEGSFTFKGNFIEAMGELYLYQTNGYLYGNIHIDSLAYQIEPINKKYAVLLRRDYSKDVCPLGEEHGEKGDTKESPKNDAPKSKSALMTDPVIDVMVVFSNEAAAATQDMESLAEGAIQSSNDSFSNSDAGLTFNLVHYQQVNYNESGSGVTDRNRLIATSDGHMDNVHALRYQYGADVVILIYDNSPGLCGVAAGIGVNSSNAFATTRDDCAIGNYTFAHEIGHLAGARHDTDPNDEPYAYGHGFRYDPGYWRTVMAVYDDDVNRIPYWSNPGKTYGGVTMGTTSWRDNARVWDVRAATMAGFDGDLTPPPPPPPSVTISGPTQINQGTSHTWNASVTGGEPPYSYNWYKKTTGSYNLVGYGSSYTGSSMTTFDLKVEVTDDNNKQDDYNIGVLVSDPGGCTICTPVEHPEDFALRQNHPNPFNPSTTIHYTLPEEARVTIKVFNIMGREVATLVSGSQSPGYHQVEFNAGNLSSGLYMARMEALGTTGKTFTQHLKMQLIK